MSLRLQAATSRTHSVELYTLRMNLSGIPLPLLLNEQKLALELSIERYGVTVLLLTSPLQIGSLSPQGRILGTATYSTQTEL